MFIVQPLETLVPRLVYYLLLILVAQTVADSVGLAADTEVIRIVVACVLGGITLAFGLSFGLGTREITRNLIAGFYARKIFQPGDELEIKGERGVLRSITPTQTLLVQPGDKIVAVSNASFLEDVVRQ